MHYCFLCWLYALLYNHCRFVFSFGYGPSFIFESNPSSRFIKQWAKGKTVFKPRSNLGHPTDQKSFGTSGKLMMRMHKQIQSLSNILGLVARELSCFTSKQIVGILYIDFTNQMFMVEAWQLLWLLFFCVRLSHWVEPVPSLCFHFSHVLKPNISTLIFQVSL